MKKTIVIKIGGVASSQLDNTFFKQIHQWQASGVQVIIVHGGGNHITEMLEQFQQKTEKKDGLRVTTPSIMEITKMVLVGKVQPDITKVLSEHHIQTVGLNAGNNHLITGELIDREKYGWVGKVTKVNTFFLQSLLAKNLVPVIAPLGMTTDNEWLNINADEAACKIASFMQADALYLLTDVPGVKVKDKWLQELPIAQVEELKREKIIHGGMLPKLSSAMSALAQGVSQVHVTNNLQSAGTVIK